MNAMYQQYHNNTIAQSIKIRKCLMNKKANFFGFLPQLKWKQLPEGYKLIVRDSL